MSTADEHPTQPLPTDPTAPQEDPVTTPLDTGPSAAQPDDTGSTDSTFTTDTAARTAGDHPGTPSGPAPVQPAAPAPRERRGIRVGTMVWGLVLAALGVGVVAWAIGLTFDTELAFIVLVAAAGVLLLVGSLATTLRRRR